ncbi:hypothetical protein [Tropicimonas isoalkanivorans]|uniref:Uncharacterized protein n=1 Tax=Tropicimonas isoalkanivorans TaxID=441112 RepID=A0A1I1HXM1_9RHOB|nr:hypothetical protein [Tropicimonas isoalkanivorans]SFC28694.1 hypothetical protein SAMN04488094_103322 [Tropicimonas isoalkanivorans]
MDRQIPFLFAFALSAVSTVATAETRQLVFSTHASSASTTSQAQEGFFDPMTDATGGSLTFELGWGGALAGAETVLSSLRAARWTRER